MADLKMLIFIEIQVKIDFFSKKVQNIGISPNVLPIKKGNGVSNMFCNFLGPYHADIFENGDFKYFQVATTPRTLGLWRLTLPPC